MSFTDPTVRSSDKKLFVIADEKGEWGMWCVVCVRACLYVCVLLEMFLLH